MAILGVDVGGTFTDAVLLDGDRVRTAKVPTAARQEESVLAAVRAVGAAEVERFAHGTTVATNALLERRGARTAFVGTEGFEHLLHLRRQTRAHLYRLCESHPEPLVPLERCIGVRGRLGPGGELVPLDLATLPDVGDAESVAVCLLFSFRDPGHEAAVAAELRRRHPGVHVVASHEVAPEFREYERASTTAADAYLAPVAARYLRALAAGARAAGLPEPLVMLSGGGVVAVEEAAAHPATILVSGPAAGVVGAGLVARRAGFDDAIAFDMGGTSTDVCLLPGGRAERVAERVVGGFPIRLPTVDVHTVGRRRRLARPPRRRRCDPRRAGERRRASGAGLLRRGRRRDGDGREPAARPSAGGAPGRARARPRRGRRARSAGSTRPRWSRSSTRRCCVRSASSRWSAAATRATSPSSRSAAPARCTRARSRRSSGSGRCSFPRRPAFSRRSASSRATSGATASSRTCARSRTCATFPSEGEADLRYRGQSFELTVPLQADLAAAFHRAHDERYGYADEAREIELVAVRTAEVVPGPEVSFRATGTAHGDWTGARRASRRDLLGARTAGAARRTTTGRWC